MKYLGYLRTPTDAMYLVTMPDGSRWSIPVQIIVDCRDQYYSSDREDTVRAIRDGELDPSDISHWAANNMNWSEVKAHAALVPGPAPAVDFQEGWVNGEREIVGEV